MKKSLTASSRYEVYSFRRLNMVIAVSQNRTLAERYSQVTVILVPPRDFPTIVVADLPTEQKTLQL